MPPVRAAVRALVELEVDDVVADAGRAHGVAERGRGQVEAVLVVAPGVDPDRARLPERVAVRRRQAHGIAREPALPHLGHELARVDAERQLDRAVLARRVRARLGVGVREHRVDVVLEHRPPRAEVLPEALVRAVVAVAQLLRDLGELGRDRHLEEPVARVGGEPAEEVGPLHPPGHRPEPAGRLAGDAAVLPCRRGAEPRVDERHDLLAEVRAVVRRWRASRATATRRPT